MCLEKETVGQTMYPKVSELVILNIILKDTLHDLQNISHLKLDVLFLRCSPQESVSTTQ